VLTLLAETVIHTFELYDPDLWPTRLKIHFRLDPARSPLLPQLVTEGTIILTLWHKITYIHTYTQTSRNRASSIPWTS